MLRARVLLAMSTIAALMILGPVNVGAVECLYSDTTAAFPPPPSNSLIGGFDFTQTYPDFCSVFYVIIDSAIVAAWDSVGIAQFIELVMDADTTNADDVFPAVWDYFLLEGADSNSAYARVEYTVNGFPLTQIGISIENKLGSSYQGGGGVHLGAQGKDPDEVARDGFAHELQHLCHAANNRGFRAGKYDKYHSIDESLSAAAEQMWRPWEVVWQVTSDDQAYDASIYFGETCDVWPKPFVNQVWMGYLFDAYKGSDPDDVTDDLLYRWIRQDEYVTMASLSAVLEDPSYGTDYDWLGGSTGDERLQNLFQYYAIAKYCAAPNFSARNRYGYDDFSPKDDIGFFRNLSDNGTTGDPQTPVNCPGQPGGGGFWNVRVLPPQYLLSNANEDTMLTVSGIYTDADGSHDYIDVATYGTDYIIFESGTDFEDGAEHELHFTLRGTEDSPPPNTEVKLWLIGYDAHQSAAQTPEGNIVFVDSVYIDPDSTKANVVVTDLGRSIKSVGVALTLVETTASDTTNIDYFEYSYDYGVYSHDSGDVAWAGDVLVTGDVTVSENATLVVDAGTNVRVWPADLSEAGGVDSLVELIVQGNLDINGTTANPVRFQWWDRTLPWQFGKWYGIVFPDSTSGSGEINHCIIQNAYSGISTEVNLTVSNTEIRNCDYGVFVSGGMDSVVLDSLLFEQIVASAVEVHDASPVVIRNSTIRNTCPYSVCYPYPMTNGVRVYGVAGDYGVTIDNCTIRDADNGVSAAERTTVKNAAIANCNIGINAWGDSVYVDSTTVDSCGFAGVSLSLGIGARIEDSSVRKSSTYGVRATRGTSLYLVDSQVDDNYTGLMVTPVDAQALSVQAEDCSFSGNSNHGIKVEDTPDVTIGHSTVSNNTTSGIYCVDNGDATLVGNSITGNGIGVYADGSAPSVLSSNYVKSNTTGIKCDNNSDAVVESTVVESNGVGVIASNGSDPDLGTYGGGSSAGRNSIINTTDDVKNLDSLVTVKAERNWWGVAPPDAGKFVGNVDYDPYLSLKPSYEPQIEESFAYRRPESPGSGEDPGAPSVPTTYALSGAYPNPFNPTTTIAYEVPAPGGMVQLAVYNVRGQLVSLLVNDFKPAGYHSAVWDGRTRTGGHLSSGVYFVHMVAPAFVNTRKVVLLK